MNVPSVVSFNIYAYHNFFPKALKSASNYRRIYIRDSIDFGLPSSYFSDPEGKTLSFNIVTRGAAFTSTTPAPFTYDLASGTILFSATSAQATTYNLDLVARDNVL